MQVQGAGGGAGARQTTDPHPYDHSFRYKGRVYTGQYVQGLLNNPRFQRQGNLIRTQGFRFDPTPYSGPAPRVGRGDADNNGTRNGSSSLGVRGRQRLLVSLGYHINGGVDGVWGPSSRNAWKAHLNGVKPHAYNSRGTSAAPPAAPPRGGGGGGGGGGAGGGGGGGGRGGPRGPQGGRQPAAPAIPQLNPKRYARGLTNQMYAPILNQIRHQRGESKLQGAQDLADIQKWYGDAHQAALEGIKGNDTADQALLQQQGQDQRSMADAILGDHSPAGGTAAAFAALMHGNLAGLMANAHEFGQGTANSIAAEGAQQGTDQTRLNAQQLQDINNALQGQLAAKAGAYQTNLGNAQTQALQNRAAQQNMDIAAKQFGLQQSLGRQQLAQSRLTTQALRRQVSSDSQGVGGKWKNLSSGDLATMSSGLNSITYIKGKSGAYIPLKGLGPEQAWKKAANYMRQLKWDVAKNGHSRQWLANWFRNYVADYNKTPAGRKNPYKVKANGTPYKLWPGDPGYNKVHH